ncbi:MAG TPA: hypothetical protein DCR46_04310 [Cytophagales bacterium]|jgi:hypothetical protein|nr:hypothetical protein [Cytophagales bacterium]
MFNFIGKWFAYTKKSDHEDRKMFLEAVELMLDGEATPEQQKMVMDRIRRCQFSNSKYELEKCIREKLKSLNCCQDTPPHLSQAILQKISTQNSNQI